MQHIDKRGLLALALAFILVFAAGMKYADLRYRQQESQEIITESSEAGAEPVSTDDEQFIEVYVTGAVAKPGVYQLGSGARVHEAVDMAEALPNANLRIINLALRLEDGQAILVPAQGEENITDPAGGVVSPALSPSGLQSAGKVNINSASAQEMDERLPGIGPAIAQRIVEYRTSQGPFGRIEDLMEVSGIGDKKFAELKELIRVR